MDPTAARLEVDRLAGEYADRVRHWQAHPPFGLESDLLGRQHAEGERFLAGERGLVAALAAGRTDDARRQLQALSGAAVFFKLPADAAAHRPTALLAA